MFLEGNGVMQDYSESARWMERAGQKGDKLSQFRVGLLYLASSEIEADYTLALSWFQASAGQGYAPAQSLLAAMYYDGLGVAQDFEEAAKRYRQAAEQGDATAQFKLGGMFFNGEGVIKDSVTSYMWINISAVSGNQLSVDARDLFESAFPADQVADGQLRARICFSSDYQD